MKKLTWECVPVSVLWGLTAGDGQGFCLQEQEKAFAATGRGNVTENKKRLHCCLYSEACRLSLMAVAT